jgi:hypothetical protein
MELCLEGMKLLEAEEKSPTVVPPKQDDQKKLETALGTKSANPYVRARIKILTDLPEARRKMIEKMEADGKIDNRTYDDFNKAIASLGDKLSP